MCCPTVPSEQGGLSIPVPEPPWVLEQEGAANTHLAHRAVLSPHNNWVELPPHLAMAYPSWCPWVSLAWPTRGQGVNLTCHGQHPPGLMAPHACSAGPSPNISTGLWVSV